MESSSYPRTIEESARKWLDAHLHHSAPQRIGMKLVSDLLSVLEAEKKQLEAQKKRFIEAKADFDEVRAYYEASLEAVQRMAQTWRTEAEDCKGRGYLESWNTLHGCANALDLLMTHVDGSRVTRRAPATAATDLDGASGHSRWCLRRKAEDDERR